MNTFVLRHREEGRVPAGWIVGLALLAGGLFALALPTEAIELFDYRLSRSVGVGATLLLLGSATLGLLGWALSATEGAPRTEVDAAGLRVFDAGKETPRVVAASSITGFRTERRQHTFRVRSRGNFVTVNRVLYTVLAQPSNSVVYVDRNGWFAARAERRLRAAFDRPAS